MSSDAAEPSSSDAAEPAKPKPDATTTPAPHSGVKFTRAGALWTALIAGFLILILLLVFILQNTNSAEFAFLGWRWSLPLGVAILLAAVGGGLVTVAVGTARIYQLRRVVRKNLKSR
jgi:uncharacterized integral membrane protein